MHYLLMTGESAHARVPGWVEVAQLTDVDAACADAWRRHGEALAAEAAGAGFVHAGVTGRRPTGLAVEQWRTAFLQAHGY